MPVLGAHSTSMVPVREGISRRLIHADNLMMVVIDFTNGPWSHREPLMKSPDLTGLYILKVKNRRSVQVYRVMKPG
jgi:hypothetical protein